MEMGSAAAFSLDPLVSSKLVSVKSAESRMTGWWDGLIDISLFLSVLLFCFQSKYFSPRNDDMMVGRDQREPQPRTVLLVSVHSQNIAGLCCGFHLIIIMSRKKPSPTPRPQLQKPWKYSNLSRVKFWQRRQQGFFAQIKDLYGLGKEKLDDIKIFRVRLL